MTATTCSLTKGKKPEGTPVHGNPEGQNPEPSEEAQARGGGNNQGKKMNLKKMGSKPGLGFICSKDQR